MLENPYKSPEADKEALKQLIRDAFADVKYPGDWCLKDSNEGFEPFLVEQEFAGKDEWQSLPASFLDNAPDGLASALSFFSDEAFRFYLPAYLIADVDEQFERVSPDFYLTHGLESSTRGKRINFLRYGFQTWWDEACRKFSMFTQPQAVAITAYLQYKLHRGDGLDEDIEQALEHYWLKRASGKQP